MMAAASGVGAVDHGQGRQPGRARTAPTISGPKLRRPDRSLAEQAGRRRGPRARQRAPARRRPPTSRPKAAALAAARDRRRTAPAPAARPEPARPAPAARPRRPPGRCDAERGQQRRSGSGRGCGSGRPRPPSAFSVAIDGLAALQIGADRAEHAQPAGDQRGQADEAQEVFQLVDQPADARARRRCGRGCGRRAVRRLPQRRPCRLARSALGGQGDPRRLAERQAGRRGSRPAPPPRRLVSTRGPSAKPRDSRSGSAISTRAGDHGGVADQEPVAELQVQPVQQRLLDRRAGDAVLRSPAPRPRTARPAASPCRPADRRR